MKRLSLARFVVLIPLFCVARTVLADPATTRTIHVFVALCDNKHQGIVPVRDELGDGDKPRWNLYWGALYGVKTYFKKHTDWELISTRRKPGDPVLERCIFRHKTANVFLIADAYRGREIKQAIQDFLDAASGNKKTTAVAKTEARSFSLGAAGSAQLLAYIGHNGLMDFRLSDYPRKRDAARRDVIVLACKSKSYFADPIRTAGANALLGTTGLMAPEAYTLADAIDGWIRGESREAIRLRAAKAYAKYQKCSLRAARNLFATDW